ncbi:MAG: thiamine pyrophosphate-dependent dehydrogenase E1 component subunit alpha [Candidatus Limnocylindrales bacterium]
MTERTSAPAEHAMLPDPLGALARMWLIRAFEEKASELFARGRIKGLLHLGIGQEGTAVGATGALAPADLIVAGHRAHAHALAKGADPVRLLAEIAGRRSGYCGGKGGSMHIAAPEVGFLTATGVVGGNIPLALGAAWAARQAGEGALAMAAFGDGAGQTGSFHEALNIASLWVLPMIFLCENNGYAEFTPLSAHTKVERLSRHAETYGIPATIVDGNDLLAVRSAMDDAIGRARSGAGPSFVEALTYRLHGHYEGDPGKYRELSELAEWKSKDPIARFGSTLLERGLIDHDRLAQVEAGARSQVEAAAAAALAAPVPDAADLLTDVYA